jgi:CHAT domain-containing protein
MKRILPLIGLLLAPLLALPSTLYAQEIAAPSQINQADLQPIDNLIRTSQQLMKGEDYQGAYQQAKQALALSQARGDKLRQVRALRLLAIAAFHAGDTEEAIIHFKQVATLADESDSAEIQSLQTLALGNAGGLLRVSGLYEEALFCFTQALRLYKQRQDRAGEALTLSRLSSLYTETGDPTKATQLLQEALPMAHTLNDRELEATLLLRLVIIEKDRGNLDNALRFGQQALALEIFHPVTNSQQDRLLKALLNNLGQIYAALENYAKATEMFEQGLKLCRDTRTPPSEALMFGNFAWTQFKSGKLAAALDSASRAIAILQRGGGNKHLEAQYLSTIAEVQRAQGRREEALANYRQAITTLEQARLQAIPTEISRAGIISTRRKVFAGAIDFLLQEQRPEEAFEVAEAYHARAFLDVLAESRIDSSRELSKEQKEQESKIFERISTVQKELWKADVSPLLASRLKKELEAAENTLEGFQLELRRASPRYASIKYPKPVGLERINKEILAADTALVEFVLSEEKSFAWVVHQGKVASVILPSRREIDALIADYRASLAEKVSALTVNSAIAKLNAKSQVLYQKLFQPLAFHLSSAQKLIIVADGSSVYLPFETLVRENRSADNKPVSAEYLIERFAISYAPSASALAAIREMNSRRASNSTGIVAFGDPDYTNLQSATRKAANSPLEKNSPASLAEPLFEFRQLPYTRTEVNEIAALFPATERRIFLGAEAHEEHVKTTDLSHYRYVHFAAHGKIDEEYPARSGIVLSLQGDSKEDGALQLSEVMRLKLNADLVTLSACRTGLGKLLNGEGMIGLTRAFLYAGADSVVVSLWNVNDVATADFMKSFYKHLRQGMAKDAALRQAKLDLLKGQKRLWQHPRFWAPFVLIGEPN